MGNKLSYVLKKCKNVLIVCLILWIVLSIVLIAPMTASIVDTTLIEGSSTDTFFEIMINNYSNIGGNLGKVFKSEYIGTFLKGELYLSIALLFFTIVGMVKTMPKHDYQDIEHGSSDWASGEQYSILHKSKGILLAEKHYLPVDKRGNVNVLVVGRFRFW